MSAPNSVAQQAWESELPSEIGFWRALIDGTYPNKDWVTDLRLRMSGQYPFPDYLRNYVREGARILDVGAGPATVIGTAGAPPNIKILAIDPLADKYNAVMNEHGLVPIVRTSFGEAERLSELQLGKFDLVYSRNALDHSYDALRSIREMVAAASPNGVVFFEGAINEGVNQRYHGLHQWSFMPIDSGDLVIWNRSNHAISLRAALGDFAIVNASASRAEGAADQLTWYKVEIKMKKRGLISFVGGAGARR